MRRCVRHGALAALFAASLILLPTSAPLAGDRPVRPAAASPNTRAHRDIRIGLLLAGGAYAGVSDDIAAGLDLAVTEAGRTVNGRHLVVIREDGDGAPADAATRARGLAAAAAVDVLVGPATLGEAAALRDAATEARLPLIVPVPAAGVTAAKCSPYVFHVVPSDDERAGILGAWIAGAKPAKHVYVLVPQDAPARAAAEAFQRQFEAAGGEIVGQESVSGSNPDFSPYLAKLRLVGADTLYAPFTGAAAKALAQDYQSLGLEKRVAFLGAAAPPVADGAIHAADYMPGLGTPENQRFRAAFAKRFGRPPSGEAARGYDAGRVIVEALRTTRGHIEQAGGFAAVLAQVSFTGPRGAVRGAALNQVYIVRARAPAGDELLDRTAPISPDPADSCHAPDRS